MTNAFKSSEYVAFRIEDSSSIKYLEQVIDILAQNSWVYETRNTELFLHNVLEKIPIEWYESLNALSAEDLQQVPIDFMKENWPTSLKVFIEQCQSLAEHRFPLHNFGELVKAPNKPEYMTTKVSSKKQYEIESMSYLISIVCELLNCSVILDIGSGLGYLDQILHHRYGLQCIGLDSSSQYTLAARDRLKNDPCANSMKHQTMEVKYSGECIEALKTILKEEVKFKCSCNTGEKYAKRDSPTMMVGLHSCGNFTQDMMRLFCEMEEIACFICVGCCYNKINLNDFPMSKTAQSAVSRTSTMVPGWSPCTSGLRLATHGTRTPCTDAAKQSHLEKSMFYRALFEKYIREENISWCQPKRHIRPSDVLNFETYCKNMLKKHPLGNDLKTLQNLSELYDSNKHLFPKIRILLVLQTLLQPLWESFVIVDRMFYFKENNLSTEVLAMWDNTISSRNMALCAFR